LLPVAAKFACAGIEPEAAERELPIRHSPPHRFPGEIPELGQDLPDLSEHLVAQGRRGRNFDPNYRFGILEFEDAPE
jgi:hypothetical protein